MIPMRLILLYFRGGCVAQNSLLNSNCGPSIFKCENGKQSISTGEYVVPFKFSNFSPPIRGFKSDLKIKWVRPTKIPCIKPEKSGDLSPLPRIDPKQFPLGFDKCEELKDADEYVKRVFSLEFMPRRKSMEVIRSDLVNSVKRHALDRRSMEAKIALMTALIRDQQNVMEHCGKNKRVRVQLKELIDRRKKFLKYLRRWDYKKFEWLLEKLNLVYHPPPDHFHWITRKESLRKLTDKYCEDIKEERLAAYKEHLESQKVAFLEEKAAKLKWIVEEENACGVQPSISHYEIESVLRQLEQLKVRQGINKEVAQ